MGTVACIIGVTGQYQKGQKRPSSQRIGVLQFLLSCTSWGNHSGTYLSFAALETLSGWNNFLGSVYWKNLKIYTIQLGQGMMNRVSRETDEKAWKGGDQERRYRTLKVSTYSKESGVQCMPRGDCIHEKRSERQPQLIFGLCTSKWKLKHSCSQSG